MIKKLIFLLSVVIVTSLGCIESKELSAPNEIDITTPAPALSPTEQKLPSYNETEPFKINDFFETWSRGYWSNSSYKQPYFRVITNYSAWTVFLDEQGYRKTRWGLEGELYPGLNAIPATIAAADFEEYFIIATMMGLQGKLSPEIEIKNISRMNEVINVTVRMYAPGAGAAVVSAPYHIVIVKRELLPKGNSTFIFKDTEDKELGIVEIKE